MASRLTLHAKFEELLGNNNCYYQPPESIKMKFPCIRYSLTRINTLPANDSKYNKRNQYNVIFIHKDPESEITEKILDTFDTIRMDRRYTADNIYHDVYTLYY